MSPFHPFPRLPYELRALIWDLAMQPRTVELQTKRLANDRYVVYSPTPAPAVLHACHEARDRGQRTYQKALQAARPEDDDGAPGYIWIDFAADTVFVGQDTGFEQLAPVARLVRHLRFEREYGATYRGHFFFHCEVRELRLFTHVEDVHVVCADGLRAWWGLAEDHGDVFSCGAEDVYLVGPEDGRVMGALELDEVCAREQEEGRGEEDEDEEDEECASIAAVRGATLSE